MNNKNGWINIKADVITHWQPLPKPPVMGRASEKRGR